MNRLKIKLFFGAIILSFLIFPKNIFAQILINEFSPKVNPEWVEFINIGTTTINLDGYYFDDDSDFNSDSGNSIKIKLKGLFSAGSLCFLDINSFLNDSGDSPTLFAPNGDILDTYTYASSSAGLSYSRIPDGGDWQVDSVFSKTINSCLSLLTPTPVPTDTPTEEPTQELTNTLIVTSTPTLSATPTKTSSPKPTKTPTPKPTDNLDSTIVPMLVGLTGDGSTPEGLVKGTSTSKKSSIFPIFLVVSGLSFMGFGGINLYKKMKTEYNTNNENT